MNEAVIRSRPVDAHGSQLHSSDTVGRITAVVSCVAGAAAAGAAFGGVVGSVAASVIVVLSAVLLSLRRR